VGRRISFPARPFLFAKVLTVSNGFLGYNTSFMLDVVVCALLVVVPVLLLSLWLVKVRRNYALHKTLQLVLGVTLLVAVGLFEIDMRMQGGIRAILEKRAVPLTAEQAVFFYRLLWVHLFFSITTVILWVTTIALALKRIPCPPAPCSHSPLHKKLGWLSALDITLTAVTGLAVYYFGFMR